MTGDQPFKYIINENGYLYIAGVNSKEQEGEVFEYTFIVGEVDPNMPLVGSNFKQVLYNKDADNHTTELEANQYYIIGRHYNDVAVAMSVNTGTSSGNANIRSTQNVSADAIDTGSQKFDVLSTTGSDVLIFKLENNDGKWALKTVNLGSGLDSEQKYLYAPDESKTTLEFADNFKEAFMDISSQNNANIYFAPVDKLNRTISTPSNNDDYFNYQTSGNVVQLYKYTTLQKFDPKFEDQKLKVTETYTITLPDDAPKMTFDVKGNTTVIAIEGNVITAQNIKSTDAAIVVATWDETEKWFAGKAEFNVKVSYPADLSFRHGTDPENPVRGKKDVGVVWQAVYYTGDGTVTYSIEPDDIEINPITGQITPDGIANAQIETLYTVTAHVEDESNTFVNGDAFYYIVIEEGEANEPGSDGEDIFESFGDNGNDINDSDHWYTVLPVQDGGYTNRESTHRSKTTNIEYTLKNAYIAQNSKRYYLQMQKAADGPGTISFTLPENCTGISLKGGWGLSSSPQVEITVNGEVVNEAFTINKDAYTKYEFGDIKAKSIVTITSGKNVPMIASIKFHTAEIAGKDLPASNLSFPAEQRVISMFEDEVKTLPTLSFAEGFEFSKVKFDIDEVTNENEEVDNYVDYTINVDAPDFAPDNIKIEVKDPGVYTFRAFYEGEEFLNSMAILRLNVFPRLTVNTSEGTAGNMSNDERGNNPELTIVEATEKDGKLMTVINLPTLDELKDQFKYSTVTVDKVTVKHGDNDAIDLTPEQYQELNGQYEFEGDGYVEYTLVYANTDDFKITSRVNVIHVPSVPTATIEGVGDDKKIVFSINDAAFNKNAQIQYRAKASAQGQRNMPRRVDASEVWITAEENEISFAALVEKGINEIEFRSAKDISEIAGTEIDNGYLGSAPTSIVLAEDPVKVVVTIPENQGTGTFRNVNDVTEKITAAFEIKTESGTAVELTEGTHFTITIAPQNGGEGWTMAESEAAAAAVYEKLPGYSTNANDWSDLYAQYKATSENAKVDGVYYPFEVSAEYDGEDLTYSVTGNFPCSGAYTLTISPVEGSGYEFVATPIDVVVKPNLQLMYGDIPGFNINGCGFTPGERGDIQYPKMSSTDKTLWEPSYVENGQTVYRSFAYTPGIYFATNLEVEVTQSTDDAGTSSDQESEEVGGSERRVKRNANSNYYGASLSLSGLTGGSVVATITKNGVSSDKTYFALTPTDNMPTGVEAIGAEDDEVRYFTPQGLQVKNPRPGEIYIVVKGGKASKVLF